MIQENEVVFVKITSEPVFVLQISDPAPKLGDKDVKVKVRRCNMGQNGSEYVLEYFTLAELESKDQLRKRVQIEREEFNGPKAGFAETSSFSA